MPKRPKPQPLVVSYLRVSTTEQATSGAGISAQRAAVEQYAERVGLTVTHVVTDGGISGSMAPAMRPGLSRALADLDQHGGTLIAAKTDRSARKTSDLLALVDRAAANGWALVAVDGSINTSTPHGRAMTTVASAFAQLELELGRMRTREALAQRKLLGVRLGQPSALPQAVKARIGAERTAGMTLMAIAEGLTRDAVPTVRGGARWYASTVRAALGSIALDEYAASRVVCVTT